VLALARYTLKGPYQASAVVGILAIVAVFFPLFSGSPLLGAMVGMLLTYLSASLVGLIILTQGIQSGIKAIIVAVLGITLVTTVVLEAPGLGISIALAQWLPIIVLAQTFRATSSIALTLVAGVALGFVAVVAQYAFLPELEKDWVEIIMQSVAQLPQQQEYDIAALTENVRLMVHWLILALGASMYLLYASIVLVARWLQARVASSDGYRREFLTLSFGKPASIVAMLLVALSSWLDYDLLTSLAILILAAFLFQGIAVVHAKIAGSKIRPMLTGLFYALLLIFPQIMAVTVLAGVIDNWLIFRKNGNIENSPD